MVQCTPTIAEDAVRIVSAGTAAMIRMAHRPDPDVPRSRQALVRERWFDWHRQHGRNVSLTCRHFGISRPTFYRWQRRYDPRRPATLEAHSCRPHRRRAPTWTTNQALAVQHLREQYPRWGKAKLQRLLAREQVHLSVSMVGRILAQLKRRGALLEPLRRISARKRPWRRPYAVRKPREYAVVAPGDLVQLDTLDVRPVAGAVLKQFTARDVVSRWDVLDLASRATAGTATRALGAILERMPFPVRAIQVDGGSEFMAEFEQHCQQRGIRLFALPPRSPKLNGAVERANRTHTEEFYECSTAEPTVAALGAELRAWETTYNTVRPHQALAYQTPLEFITAWKASAQADAQHTGREV
jgi:putative transposase